MESISVAKFDIKTHRIVTAWIWQNLLEPQKENNHWQQQLKGSLLFYLLSSTKSIKRARTSQGPTYLNPTLCIYYCACSPWVAVQGCLNRQVELQLMFCWCWMWPARVPRPVASEVTLHDRCDHIHLLDDALTLRLIRTLQGRLRLLLVSTVRHVVPIRPLIAFVYTRKMQRKISQIRNWFSLLNILDFLLSHVTDNEFDKYVI